MFIRDLVQIERPFEVVAPRFLRNPAWLEPLLTSATGDGRARCHRGTARRRSDALVVPIRWAVESSASSWSLDGDLEIAPVDAARCTVTCEAAYTLHGAEAHRHLAAEHAVAAAVRVFLSCLGRALQADDG